MSAGECAEWLTTTTSKKGPTIMDNYVRTDWVCTDCHLTIAGYDEHELGHETPEPYADEPWVAYTSNGTSSETCKHCREDFGNDWPDERHDLHSEHDTDDAMMAACDACGRFGGEYHKGHAVTVEVSS